MPLHVLVSLVPSSISLNRHPYHGAPESPAACACRRQAFGRNETTRSTLPTLRAVCLRHLVRDESLGLLAGVAAACCLASAAGHRVLEAVVAWGVVASIVLTLVVTGLSLLPLARARSLSSLSLARALSPPSRSRALSLLSSPLSPLLRPSPFPSFSLATSSLSPPSARLIVCNHLSRSS